MATTDTFVVTYQPDVSRTLYEKPPVKKTTSLSFEEAAALYWFGKYLFGDELPNHMKLTAVVSEHTKQSMPTRYDHLSVGDVPDTVEVDDDAVREHEVCVIDSYRSPTPDRTWYEYLYAATADNRLHPRTPRLVTKQYTAMLYNPSVDKKRAMVLQFNFPSFYAMLVEACGWFGLDPAATVRHFHNGNAAYVDPRDMVERTQPPACIVDYLEQEEDRVKTT